MTIILAILFWFFLFYFLTKKLKSKSKGNNKYILKSEYDKLHNEHIKTITQYFGVKHKLDDMEKWHGSHIQNQVKAMHTFLTTDDSNPLERLDKLENENKQILIKKNKEVVQIVESKPKKINPNQLTYTELESCMNYFIENQHKLKNQSK